MLNTAMILGVESWFTLQHRDMHLLHSLHPPVSKPIHSRLSTLNGQTPSQIPGNIVLRRLGVRNWLTFLIFAWGIVQLGMGWVQNWEALLATRILLGIFEVSFAP
jgi:hypothetical protein